MTRADPILLAPYDPSWPARFAAEATRLRDALGEVAVRIDHVGSTSIPGISAKDVIDIQVSVPALRPPDCYVAPLARAGYAQGESSADDRYPFFHRPRRWPHAFHVHVCERASGEERRHLAFCAYLRDHPELAAAYEREKRALAKLHSAATLASRQAYSEAKSVFIQPIERRAIAEGYPRADPLNPAARP